MPIKPITGWYPDFDDSGNFQELYGWDVVLRQIFTVLITRPGSRQWQPEFGCRLLDLLFDTDITETTFNDCIKTAFKWLPHIKLKDVECKVSQMTNFRGQKASIKMSIAYNGETRDVSFEIPSQLDLMNGQLHQIRVRR